MRRRCEDPWPSVLGCELWAAAVLVELAGQGPRQLDAETGSTKCWVLLLDYLDLAARRGELEQVMSRGDPSWAQGMLRKVSPAPPRGFVVAILASATPKLS